MSKTLGLESKYRCWNYLEEYGACTKALKNLGLNVNIVDYVEIDKYACKSYNAINGTDFEPQDIKEWDKDINVDLIMHGSPCQDFSVSGLQAGGDEGSGTRSSLMYESIRIISKLNPKYVVWENVKNLLNKKHKHNFDNYINKLDELGYNSYYKVLDAKDYNVPQHRERLYTVSIRKDIDKGNFRFPEKEPLKIVLKDLLEKEVDEKYYMNDKQVIPFKNSTFNSRKTRMQEKDYCDTLCARDFKNPQCIQVGELVMKGYRIMKAVYSPESICPTLTTCGGGNTQAKIKDKNGVRKLVPLEYWRLMSFDDEDFYKAQSAGNSNSQLYKQAGNSIVVKVLEKIFKNLLTLN